MRGYRYVGDVRINYPYHAASVVKNARLYFRSAKKTLKVEQHCVYEKV